MIIFKECCNFSILQFSRGVNGLSKVLTERLVFLIVLNSLVPEFEGISSLWFIFFFEDCAVIYEA